MTRRIVAALLVFTAALLVGAVVPLALQAVAHVQDGYINAAQATARSIAVIAEEKLGDHVADPELGDAIHTAAHNDDEVLVLDANNQVVASQLSPHDNWHTLAAEATQQDAPASQLTKDRVIVVQPVWNDGKINGQVIGTVVLERPVAELNAEVTKLWLYVTLLSASAMAAAVLIAICIARWVSRPLARLDTAARNIADGDLTVRAQTRYGPPELRRMAGTFNMMAGRLEALVHGHRAMLADASHQLRTPLTALRLRLELLAADSGPDAAAELSEAQAEIARLSRLVDGLLATARAEAAGEQLEIIDAAEAVNERVAAWQPVADGHGVKLVAERQDSAPAGRAATLKAGLGAAGLGGSADSSRPIVVLGSGHLEQILDNLLDNAIDALAAAGGTVRVTVGRSDAGTTLTVADDGPGMTAQERSRAFLRFTTGSQNGTGLGLAIVHRLVTTNGGTIRLADTPGGGLTVVIDFLPPAEP